jgi:hypothetical protein
VCVNSGIAKERQRVRGGDHSQEEPKETLVSILELPGRRDPRVELGVKFGHTFKERKRFSAACSIFV